MIVNKCDVPDTLPFNQMLPFQGALKHRSEQDIEQLADSLLNDGLLMPFVIWKQETLNHLIDGHGRYAAIQHLAMQEPALLGQEYPVIYVRAETLDEAKKSLLQINAQYGKITTKGLKAFLEGSPQISVHGMHLKAPKIKLPVTKPVSEYKVLKIKVQKSYEQEILNILKQCSYVEVL